MFICYEDNKLLWITKALIRENVPENPERNSLFSMDKKRSVLSTDINHRNSLRFFVFFNSPFCSLKKMIIMTNSIIIRKSAIDYIYNV